MSSTGLSAEKMTGMEKFHELRDETSQLAMDTISNRPQWYRGQKIRQSEAQVLAQQVTVTQEASRRLFQTSLQSAVWWEMYFGLQWLPRCSSTEQHLS